MTRARVLWLLFVLALAAGVAVAGRFFGFGPFTESSSDHAVVLSGNIEAHQSVLAFKAVQSTIAELPFEEGQWVESGTILARLDDSDYRQQVAVDEASLRVQEEQVAAAEQTLEAATSTVQREEADLTQRSADFARTDRLWKQGVTSAESREQADTVLKQARAAVERDQAMQRVAERNLAVARLTAQYASEKLKLSRIILDHTVLRAPFSGVILVRQAELGEVALPGTPVVTLADLDHVWLRAYVNETDLGRVRWGQAVTFRTDTYPAKRYQGRVSFISSKAEFTPKSVETHAERVTLVYRIKIDAENPNHELKPGMPADATIEGPSGEHDG